MKKALLFFIIASLCLSIALIVVIYTVVKTAPGTAWYKKVVKKNPCPDDMMWNRKIPFYERQGQILSGKMYR